MKGLSVGIVGATGAVGREFLALFENRSLSINELRLFASERSAGQSLPFRGETHIVESPSEERFERLDVVFLSAGAARSKQWAPIAVRAGAVAIDNSSAFRMEPDTPLVVPEINWRSVGEAKLIAVPNCSAIILLMAVAPLRAFGRIRRIVVSTYQSVSGAGAAAIDELQAQSRAVLAGEPAQPHVFPEPCAFNVFSHNTAIDADGSNEEESKIAQESRKILDQPDLLVSATCIRVPVVRAHSQSINVEFESGRPSVEEARSALAHAPGVRVVDDRANNAFPTPLKASGGYEVLVGRIRADGSHPQCLNLFVSGDQLLKGAALNAVQIAERMFPEWGAR